VVLAAAVGTPAPAIDAKVDVVAALTRTGVAAAQHLLGPGIVHEYAVAGIEKHFVLFIQLVLPPGQSLGGHHG
jgi:hypothetical protein